MYLVTIIHCPLSSSEQLKYIHTHVSTNPHSIKLPDNHKLTSCISHLSVVLLYHADAERQNNNVATACAAMVPNPIYTTGPIYEEIGDGTSRKPILTQTSYRSRDSGYIEIPLAYEKAIDSKASLSSPDSGTDSCRKFDLTPHDGSPIATNGGRPVATDGGRLVATNGGCPIATNGGRPIATNGGRPVTTDDTYTVMRPVGPVKAQIGGGGLTDSMCVDVESLAGCTREELMLPVIITMQEDDGRYITTV